MMRRPPLDEIEEVFGGVIAKVGITTGPGAGAGNSFIDASLAGAGANSYVNMLAVLYPGDDRRVDSARATVFNNGTGEVTIEHAYKGVAAPIPVGVPYVLLTLPFATTVGLAAGVAAILAATAGVQIRVIQSGLKAIAGAATKYLHIDSGTNGAEILSIAIEGLIGHDWTLDVYVPAADAEAATQPQSRRDTIAYLAADTEGGLLGPFGIPFDAYLDFTNDGANDQIDQVTITYRSTGALTLTWEV